MRTLKGNITIEASIVVPVILFLLTTLLVGALLVHDIYVLRTSNALVADAQVIAGQKTDDHEGVTFLIPGEIHIKDDKGLFWDRYTSRVTGSGHLGYIGLELSSDESRSYTVRKPKSYIRTIDFFDDASDLWAATREIKDRLGEQLDEIEEVLSGEE